MQLAALDELGTWLNSPAEQETPLVVDLDGTLVRTDTLHELIAAFLRQRPWGVLQLVMWLFLGKAGFKQRLAEAVNVDPHWLPYRTELLELLRAEAAHGRRVVLATGANARVARMVAAYCGCFSDVFASDAHTNLIGRAKAARLEREFGGGGFIYIGDSRADLPVWAAASQAIAVGAGGSCVRALHKLKPGAVHLPERPVSRIRSLIRAARVYQWSKNILIFVPVLLAHRLRDWSVLESSLLGFVSFSLVASLGYIANDLLDVEADRKHAKKRTRPFASGDLSLPTGAAFAFCLALGAAVCCLFLPPVSALWLAGYLVSTLSYSFLIKTKLAVDTIVLALFYTARILYGGAVTGIHLSIWTLAFSLFVFVSLACVKRVVELRAHEASGQLARRGYYVEDVQQLSSQAISGGYVASLVIVLYLTSPDVHGLYRRPEFLWLICPMFLYWINRMVILASRGYMDSDPIIHAFRDRASRAVAIGILLAMALAT